MDSFVWFSLVVAVAVAGARVLALLQARDAPRGYTMHDPGVSPHEGERRIQLSTTGELSGQNCPAH